MIILDSEWDEAAGLEPRQARPQAEEPEDAQASVPPSYVDIAKSHTTSVASVSAGTHSMRSLVRSSLSSQNQSSVLIEPPPSASSANGSLPSERLPNFSGSSDSARTSPVTYTFSHVEHSYNSMNVRSQTAMIPLYHVSVRLNCFIPSSYITVVTRGDEYGEEVGSFEMGLSIRKGTLIFNGREKLIDNVLIKGGSRLSRNWVWRFDSDQTKHISWTYDSPVKYCYWGTRNVGNGASLLATFTPPPLTPRADGRPSPLATLKVYPEGHKLFDHILMSVLILERRRLAPNT